MSGIKEVQRGLASAKRMYQRGRHREAAERLREVYTALQRIEYAEKKLFTERMTPVVEVMEATAALTKEIRDAVLAEKLNKEDTPHE